MEKGKVVSADQIAAWKKEHGTLMEFTVGDKSGVFRTPDLKILSAAQAQKDGVNYYKTLAKSCFLGGDEDIIDKDDYFIVLMKKLDDLTSCFNVEVKKL
jgi:hypothetical protein